jgi:VIT1/CCC1 family predicted Fe2+/Mn2+ transporter
VYTVAAVSSPPHAVELHVRSVSSKSNWLRAGVLGANDGIVSAAGIVVGVAAATTLREPVLTAGIAGLVAGAVSMALGEYVSVSTQSDTEQALLNKERRELHEDPAAEFNELAALYESRGVSTTTARTVAEELTYHDAFAAHAEVELLALVMTGAVPAGLGGAPKGRAVVGSVVGGGLALAITYDAIGHVVGLRSPDCRVHISQGVR